MSSEDGRRWNGRPGLAAALRAVILVAPAVASAAAVFLVARSTSAPHHPAAAAGRIVILLGLGLTVAFCVERVARRLLPLALILKMTMLFPDRAPSRFRVARRACAAADPSTLLREASDDDVSGVAERLVTLLATLSAHDRRTRGHAERVQVLAELVARQLPLSRADRDKLRWAALLHDIGKLTVSPAVLNKPSKLDDDEWALMRAHPEEGRRLAAPLLEWLGEWGPAIAEHHERFDGTGYPLGLSGEGISYAGRLVCIVDAYETMTAARPYKKAMATRDARIELARCAGVHFDPAIVRAFLAISLPRLLWAGGPLSFLVQIPFLPLIEAGGRIATGTLSAASTGVVAGSTALVLSSAPATAATPAPAPAFAATHVVTQARGESSAPRDFSRHVAPAVAGTLRASSLPAPTPASSSLVVGAKEAAAAEVGPPPAATQSRTHPAPPARTPPSAQKPDPKPAPGNNGNHTNHGTTEPKGKSGAPGQQGGKLNKPAKVKPALPDKPDKVNHGVNHGQSGSHGNKQTDTSGAGTTGPAPHPPHGQHSVSF